LPPELKGLKVYNVSTGEGSYVKVAVLNNSVVSGTYSVGKFEETTIVVNDIKKGFARIIYGKEVLFENDSIIILKKIKQ
jgi:cobalamin biosynthesis Co2+ chelatase CbiK